jgi:hypothetical protein
MGGISEMEAVKKNVRAENKKELRKNIRGRGRLSEDVAAEGASMGRGSLPCKGKDNDRRKISFCSRMSSPFRNGNTSSQSKRSSA